MPVYIDSANIPYGRMIMCHMVGDTLDELHAMAQAIGIRRKWFQNKHTPHYDVCLSKKILALKSGAKEVNRPQFAVVIRSIREKKKGAT